MPGSRLVGRDRQLAELLAAVEEAESGRGRLFLIGGEPGIGKSRLAHEVSARARARGATVVWGRCLERGGAPPFWPWVQILRPLITRVPGEAFAHALGDSLAYLARAMPDVVSGLPGVAPAPESEQARLGLVHAVTTLLRAVTEDGVVVIVLDDLHAADPPSLDLLALVAPDIAHRRLVVLGALRDRLSRMVAEPEDLADVARHADHLALTRLDRDAVGAMVGEIAGGPVPPQLVTDIHWRTEGLPLFVRELMRLVGVRGAGVADRAPLRPVPEGIRHTINARLAPLSPGVRGLLEQAAVLGRRFDPSLLAEMAGRARERALTELADAVAVGIVEEDTEEGRAYVFTHGLFREGLYHALPPVRRAELHGRAGTTMERRFAPEPGPHLADIAHHFLRAAPAGEDPRGVDYSVEAGDRAFDRLAYADAVRHYEDALEVIETRPRTPVRRCDILLRLGKSRFRAGRGEEARATFERAFDVARQMGDGQRMAAAAIGQASSVLAGGLVDEARVAALEEALGSLGTGEHRRGRKCSRAWQWRSTSPTRSSARTASRRRRCMKHCCRKTKASWRNPSSPGTSRSGDHSGRRTLANACNSGRASSS